MVALTLPPEVLQAHENGVLVVSRTRLLTETDAARQVRQAEADLRAALKVWVDASKEELAKRERELTDIRPDLPKEDFDLQAAAFDQQVRSVRRQSQGREAAIQQAFRAARNELLTGLYPILIDVLKSRQGAIIIDADQILLAIPQVDVTDEVIALYNQRVTTPVLPDFEDLEILTTAPEPEAVE